MLKTIRHILNIAMLFICVSAFSQVNDTSRLLKITRYNSCSIQSEPTVARKEKEVLNNSNWFAVIDSVTLVKIDSILMSNKTFRDNMHNNVLQRDSLMQNASVCMVLKLFYSDKDIYISMKSIRYTKKKEVIRPEFLYLNGVRLEMTDEVWAIFEAIENNI